MHHENRGKAVEQCWLAISSFEKDKVRGKKGKELDWQKKNTVYLSKKNDNSSVRDVGKPSSCYRIFMWTNELQVYTD